MKNINKFMLTCMIMTLGSLNIEAKRSKRSKRSTIEIQTSQEFRDQGFTQGTYMSKNNMAVIMNPDNNNMIYFNNVVENSATGLTHIGLYLKNRKCPRGQYCTAVMTNVNIYGIQVD